jgi:D-glycerate 3-kinase
MQRTHSCNIVESPVCRCKVCKTAESADEDIGTHDMHLAREFFTALKNGTPVKIPQYDKSAYNGQGDRVPSSQWEEVNRPGHPKVQVIIFEGWSVGFRALVPEAVERRQAASRTQSSATLWKHRLEDLLFVNEKLKEYDVMTNMFDAFIHIDALETVYVYDWRLEQEAALRREKGAGMTDEQVIKFIDGYYPAYELFTDALRTGVFKGSDSKGKQLRLIVGRDRKVKEAIIV